MLKISSIKFDRGFTLTELVVSIGIMIVVLTTVLSSQSTYTTGTALRQSADDISLSLRQAQVYGISVSQLSGSFDTGYGIEFRMPTPDGLNNSYILFADKKNPVYDYIFDDSWTCDTGTECLQKTVMARGNKVKEICYIPLVGSEESPCTVARADIAFLRPSTDATITLYDASSNPIGGVGITKGVRIKLVSPDLKELSVVVYTTGQISIK